MIGTRCLAFDSGTTFAGFSNILAKDGCLYVLEAGHRHLQSDCVEDLQWLACHVRNVVSEGGFVAAEQILTAYGHHAKFKSADEQLFEAKDQEGGIVWLSRFLEAEVVRIPAVKWREELGISPPRTDSQVAVVVEYLYGADVRGRFPDAETRGHAYDSLGLAAVAVARKLNNKIVMPAHVIHTLGSLRAEAKAAHKVTKKAKALTPALARFLGGWTGSAPPSMQAVAMACQVLMADEIVTQAVQIVARSKSPIAPRAKAVLVEAGLTKATVAARKPSRAQLARRAATKP